MPVELDIIKDIPFDKQSIRVLGVIPCPYHKYYYKHKEMLNEELQQLKKEKLEGKQ